MVAGGIVLGIGAGTWGASGPAPTPMTAPTPAPMSATETVRFGFCHSGGGTDCVIDGDTFRIGGTRIRIADIDAPETHPPRCDREAELGAAATKRLRQLLSAGPVTLAAADRDTDRYGRKLRIAMRGGKSIGGMLVDEGLARRWTGRRQPWC
jgi:micrococcal nuclease